ncbi:MAG: restriction endonuclease subunit S [Desulfovibrionaceae bacterium]|nr:restriction endonuclease subunit S [Desulfovibrionaceae bacterium]
MPTSQLWSKKSLHSVLRQTDTWNPAYKPRSCIRYIDVSAISNERLEITEAKSISGASAPSRARKIVKSGDTIFATIRPSLRRIAQVPPELHNEIASTAFCILRANRDCIDQRYLFFSVCNDSFITSVADLETGASYPAVRDTDILEQEIVIPPLNEQKKISFVLSALRKRFLQQFACIQNATDLKRAAMHKLFTCGLRGEPQKETEIGLVPESWICKELGDIVDIEYGIQAAVANATDPSIGSLILTNVNIELDGTINLDKRRYYKVPSRANERYTLRKGDVLFNWRSGSSNHVGKTAYFDLDGDFTYSSFILRFRPRTPVLAKYLYRWLRKLHGIGFFSSKRNVSSINSVFNASLSATIPIYFPHNEPEQQEIVDILDAIDSKIDLHRRKKAVLEELFKSMLHKLMSGEVRVDDLDLSALSPQDNEEKT